MSDCIIAYIFPSRSRVNKFFNTLDNIRSMSASKNYFVLAKLDFDDLLMNKEEIIEKIKNDYPEVTVIWNFSKGKINAINRDLKDLPKCDILIIQSDDIVWEVKGFDNEIRAAFTKYFPNLDGTVHFPDDHGKERTIIVSMLGINLYKKLGYLYHPDFFSVYADNFFTEQTKAMGKYAYVPKRLFSHFHPMWTNKDWDKQYKDTEHPENYRKDRETFIRLINNNYDL